MKTQNLKPLAAAALMLSLLSCAAPSPKIGADTQIGNNRGVVALTVQNNVIDSNLMTQFMFEWKRAFIVRQGKNNTMRYEMLARKEGMRDSIVFFAEVQPGKYRMDLLSTLMGYGEYYEMRFPEGEFDFTVEANQVTNLGTLVTAIVPKGGYSRDMRILRGVMASDTEMTDYLRGAFPKIMDLQQGRPFQTWVTSDSVSKTAELAGRIRRLSTAMSSPVRVKDGTYYAGAPMGIVWRRTLKGEWNSLDTGYAREITALAALADGGLLAAAEGGAVLRSTDRGESWKSLGPLPKYGIVVGLGEFAPGKLYALVKGQQSLDLLRADRAEGPWTTAGSFPREKESGSYSASATAAGSRLAVVVEDRELKIYDSATGAWTQETLMGDVHRSAGFEDGTLYIGHRTRQYLPEPPKDPKAPKKKGYGGSSDKPKVEDNSAILRKTVDGGVTWSEVAPFDSSTQGFSFFSPTKLMRTTDVPTDKEPRPVEHDVAFSNDGGKTWVDYPRTKRYYLASQGAVAGDKLLLFYGLNAVASADQGKTWKREEFIFPKYEAEPGQDAPGARK
jgi:hypothetical protein